MLNETVVPWFQEQGVDLLRILTDRGTEYCGKVQEHAYQLFIAIENIDHSKTKARSPQTNGICERFHRTMKQEFYDVAFRKKVYQSVDELQQDVSNWLKQYNEFRPHSGKYCYGKTPWQTFLEAKPLAREKQLDTLFELAENVVSPSGGTTGAGSIALSDDAHKNQDSQSATLCEHEKYPTVN